MVICKCTYQSKGCSWEGEDLELETHVNLENLTKETWLDGCDYPEVKCVFCNDEEIMRQEYKAKLESKLSTDDLNKVLTCSWSAQEKWYLIGLILGIDAETLDVIKRDENKDEDRFLRVLTGWLRGEGEVTWATLRESVRDFKVGYVNVAEDILIGATCKEGMKVLREKYSERMTKKSREAEVLKQRAKELANEYKAKKAEVIAKEADLSSWQGELKEHENEYTQLSKKKEVETESESMIKQLQKCREKVDKCKEKIRRLESEIDLGKTELRDIHTALSDCRTQLQTTLDELKRCEEILKKNEEPFDEERTQNILGIGDRTAKRVYERAAVTFVGAWFTALLSPLTGPLAPLVAGAAAATMVGAWSTAAGAGIYAHLTRDKFNEEQKKIDDEYIRVSDRCKETITHVQEVATEAKSIIDAMSNITIEFNKLHM